MSKVVIMTDHMYDSIVVAMKNDIIYAQGKLDYFQRKDYEDKVIYWSGKVDEAENRLKAFQSKVMDV